MALLYNKAMNAQTFFSVIIPTFNRRGFLKKAVDSVLGQTFTGFKLIIVDDGSTDGTGELIKSYNDPRIEYTYQDNTGVSSARNKGLSMATGGFVAFLDSDDFWVPEKLEKSDEHIQLFPDISIFHTEEVWYRDGKLLNQKKKHKKPSGFVYTNALPLCCISISTAVIKKDVFESVGSFDEDMEACEDYDFWLRATQKYEVKLIPEDLTIKDGGRADQLSSSVWGLDRFRIRSLEKMLNSGTLDPEYRNATLKELREKCRVFAEGSRKRGKSEIAEYYKALTEKYTP
jgi:glycosyltransferase involved in cell wall biosynthesis